MLTGLAPLRVRPLVDPAIITFQNASGLVAQMTYRDDDFFQQLALNAQNNVSQINNLFVYTLSREWTWHGLRAIR